MEAQADRLRRAKRLVLGIRVVVYGSLVLLALGVFAWLPQETPSRAPVTEWIRGATTQDMPMALLVADDARRPADFDVRYRFECTFDWPQDGVAVEFNPLPRGWSGSGNRWRAHQRSGVGHPSGLTGDAALVLDVVRERGAFSGTFRVDFTWHGRGTCTTGRVGFRIAAVRGRGSRAGADAGRRVAP